MKSLKKLKIELDPKFKTLEKEKMRSVVGGYGAFVATTIPTVYPKRNATDDANDK
jgi:hypothetical protein